MMFFLRDFQLTDVSWYNQLKPICGSSTGQEGLNRYKSINKSIEAQEDSIEGLGREPHEALEDPSQPSVCLARCLPFMFGRKNCFLIQYIYIQCIYIYVLCVCFLKGTVFCICLNRKLFVGYTSKENMFCTCLKENMFLIVSQDRKMRITCCTAKRIITFTITRVRRNKKMLRKYQKNITT